MPTHRTPKGYLGIDHQIIGRSLIALQTVLKQRDAALELEERPRHGPFESRAWYPVGVMLDLQDHLEEQIGYYGLVRTGRAIFQMGHELDFSSVKHCALEVLEGFDAMYRKSNRGQGIGGWRVLCFDPGNAEVEKTTPHHCAMEQGILTAALQAVGCPAIVVQSACVRDGAEACRFVISSPTSDERWDGRKH